MDIWIVNSFLAIANSVVIIIPIYVFCLHICIYFFSPISRSGIAERKGHVCLGLTDIAKQFSKWFINLCSHQQCGRVSISPHSC